MTDPTQIQPSMFDASSNGAPTTDTTTSDTEKKLPFYAEFSPNQVNLTWLLEKFRDGTLDLQEFVESIRQRYYSTSAPTQEGKQRFKLQTDRAMNVFYGMRSNGLVTDSEDGLVELTDVGKQLLLQPELTIWG